MSGFGINTSYSNNYGWQGVPYQLPSIDYTQINPNYSLFDYSNFNNGLNYNFGNTSISTGSSSKTTELSDEDKAKAYKKNREIHKQNAAARKEIKAVIQENKAQLAEIEAMKDADGNIPMPQEGEKIETLADRKKMPWYKRTWKAVKAMGKGVLKMGMDFLGMENGKFNLKKCIKNVSIAALAIGACFIPYVGPVISYGLLATGVIAGGVKTGIGIHKAVNAKTAVERDRAFEDVGAGAFTAISSAVGLKAKGTSFRLSNTSSASTAKTATGQWFKDFGVNSFKATKHAVVTDAAAVKAAGGGFKGYKNVVVDKTKAAWAECKPKTSFENSVKAQKSELTTKIAEIDAKLADTTISAQERALLSAQRQSYQNYNNELNSLKTKSEWTKFGREPISKAQEKHLIELREQFAKNGSVEINGQTITDADKAIFDKYITQMINEEANLTKSAGKLFSAKEDAMSRMGIRKERFKKDLNDYVGEQSNWFKYQWQLNKMNLEHLSTGQKVWHGTKAAAAAPFKLMMLPFKPYMMYEQSAANATPYKIDQLINPYYETYGEVIAATELIKAINAQNKELKAGLKELK